MSCSGTVDLIGGDPGRWCARARRAGNHQLRELSQPPVKVHAVPSGYRTIVKSCHKPR